MSADCRRSRRCRSAHAATVPSIAPAEQGSDLADAMLNAPAAEPAQAIFTVMSSNLCRSLPLSGPSFCPLPQGLDPQEGDVAARGPGSIGGKSAFGRKFGMREQLVQSSRVAAEGEQSCPALGKAKECSPADAGGAPSDEDALARDWLMGQLLVFHLAATLARHVGSTSPTWIELPQLRRHLRIAQRRRWQQQSRRSRSTSNGAK